MTLLDRFKSSPKAAARALARRQAQDLLAATYRAALDPALFGPGRIADDFTGRFDSVVLVADLVTERLGALGEPAAGLNQAFVDAVFKSFDDALREAGIGDLSVPKHMQRIAGAFYGRAGAYRDALTRLDEAAPGDPAPKDALIAAVWRNILRELPETQAFAKPLTEHALAARTRLAGTPLEALAEARVDWPAFPHASGPAPGGGD